MKRFLFLLGMVGCLTSCDNTLELTNNDLISGEVRISSNDTFLGLPKELVTLSSGIQIEKCDSIYILEGDIMLTKEQVDMLDKGQTRSALMNEFSKKWPNSTVYYTFEQNFPNYSLVNQAISHIQYNTGIVFKPRTYESSYIVFRNSSDTNSSSLGRIGGAQTIYIAQSTRDYGVAVHEIGHALGLFHEMTRGDRDSYVNINWNNIERNKDHNFQKYSVRGYQGMDFGAFDFNSVMMYDSWSFAVNDDLPTITTKNGSTFYGGSSLSSGDITALKFLYGPPYIRVHQEHEILYGIDYGELEDYGGYDHFYIRFYADRACTQRVTLTGKKHIALGVYGYQNQSPRPVVFSSESTVILEAGIQQYHIGTFDFRYRAERGEIFDNSYTYVNVY